MKGFTLWLLFLMLVTATAAPAQELVTNARSNVQALKRITTASDKEYRESLARALALAQTHGWVVEKTYEDGTHLALQGLDAKGMPVYYITHNTRLAATTRTDQLWPGGTLGLNLTGASPSVNTRLGMWDSGRVFENHQELVGRVVQKDNASETNAHATHVAGTLIASGVNPFAKGMAFGVKQLSAYSFNNDIAEMAAAASTLLVSNHSYGSVAGWRYNTEREGTKEDPYWEWWGDPDISSTEDYKFGYYNDAAASWDRIAYNAPFYLIVKSAGNNRNENGPAAGEPYFKRNKNGKFVLESARPADISDNKGYDIIATYGTAKNILTVGAVGALVNGYNQPSDVIISSFSSFGPTDDGRIKPDISGAGLAVLSSNSDSKNAYKVQNGTSMATPNVAGTLLLLQEHYANLNGGAVMRAATLKGLAIHTADESGPAPGPDYVYGWGLLNAVRAATLLSNTEKTHLLQELTMAQGQTHTFEVTASGDGPLRATISWTDPEAAVTPVGAAALNNRTPRLVNDLDVRISGRGGTFLPWKLDPLNPKEPAFTGDNILDNVEQVLVPEAIPGETYTIHITHKNTLTNSRQDFSLLVSGAGGKAYCASAAASDAGARISSIRLGDYAASFPANTCTSFRDLTGSAAITFQPGQQQVLVVQATFCGPAAPTAAKAYIDWNRNGDFTDAGEAATLTGNNGTLSGTLTAPAAAVPGQIYRMRLVLQETSDAGETGACGTYARGETQDYRIRIIQQQNDVGITSVEFVGVSVCASSAQQVLVKLRNFGAAVQGDVPVTVRVLRNSTEVARLTSRYLNPLLPYSETEFIMDGAFATEAGVTYELIAFTELSTDAIAYNNSVSRTLTVGTPAAAPLATAFRCGSDTQLSLLSSGGSATFWYSSLAATTPVAAGNQVVVPLDRQVSQLYAAVSGFSATVGPATKGFATGGGYNQFGPDVRVNTQAPMLLESARLYIGHGGQITFTAYTSTGAPVSSRTITVTPTTLQAAPGAPTPDDPSDGGAIYYLGLELPEPGEYRISISYAGGATIFRNNAGVAGYPFGIPNVFTITGNTAGTDQENYYYYFYDLKIRAIGCPSARMPVQMGEGNALPQPVISRNGNTLLSSASAGNRWYLDGRLLPEAISQMLVPDVSGDYSVVTVLNGCISEEAVPYSFIHRPNQEEFSTEIVVFPNPSSSRFHLELETGQTEHITYDVTDLTGRLLLRGKAEHRNGMYEDVIDLSKYTPGLYLLRINHSGRHYTRKLVLQK